MKKIKFVTNFVFEIFSCAQSLLTWRAEKPQLSNRLPEPPLGNRNAAFLRSRGYRYSGKTS